MQMDLNDDVIVQVIQDSTHIRLCGHGRKL
jgi:hypothetical protein